MESFTKRLLQMVGVLVLAGACAYGVFWSAREVGRVYTKTEACYQAVFSNPSAGTVGIQPAVQALTTLLVSPLTDENNKPLATMPNGQPLTRIGALDLLIAQGLQRQQGQQGPQQGQ